jgi:hypothetical protein
MPAHEAREPEPFQPPPGEFVRYEDGCTLVQFRGLVAFEWIAPYVQFWVRIAARHTAAPLDELAAAWVAAAREIIQAAPPSFDCPRDAKAQEQLEMRGELIQPEMILLPGLAREGLELLREAFEQTEAPPESPALPSAFGAWQYGKSMAPEDALRWLRLGVRLMQARGRFKAEHHVAGAELAGLAIVEFKRFHELEIAPILEAGKIYLEAKRKEREAKEPARMATEIRNTEICETAKQRRDAGKKKIATVQFLMEKHKLEKRQIEGILQEGGVYWRKTP